jgi:hypothetical protein
MALGGYVDLSTSWTDIQQNNHHAGSDADGANMIAEGVELEVTYNEMSWMVALPASGVLEDQLFPEGSVSFDSEFMTVQHSMELDMEYYGGQTTAVNADSTISATLQFNRRVNSNVDMIFNEASVNDATVLNTVDHELEAQVSPTNESVYSVITFDYDVTYNGTEILDVFTVTGELGLAQDSELWEVKIWNTSSEAYEDSVQVSLGIGDENNNSQLAATIRVQVTLPEVGYAWNLENGHRVTLRMETDLGEATQEAVKIYVPQSFGFTISDATEELGMSALVERQFSFDITNNGNGQDTFTVELLESGVPEGWSVTPMMSTLTLSKDETRTQQFTVFAPESFTSGQFDLTVYVNSQDEATPAEEVSVTITKATIKLTVDEDAIDTESDQTANEPGTVRIPVTNEGLLDAPSVIVYLTPPGMAEQSRTISVPAGETVMAEFGNLTFQQGDQRFDLRIEVAGPEVDSVESKPDDGDFSIQYNVATTADGESIWMTLLIVVLGVLVIYGGVKTARSRGGTKF